jgi:hypothetical protein
MGEVRRMARVCTRYSLVAVCSLLLGGCAGDPALKPWWTLREANFLNLQRGKTTKEEARAALGKPIAEMSFPHQGEQVWDYRFPDGAVVMLAWVYFDGKGVYKYYTAQPDPAFIYAEGS